MPIDIVCGSCKSGYSVAPEFAGKHVLCGKCGAAILVPAVTTRPGAPPAVPKRITPLDPLLDPESLTKGGLTGGASLKKPAPEQPKEELVELAFADETNEFGKPAKLATPEVKSEFPSLPSVGGPGKPVAKPAEPTFPTVAELASTAPAASKTKSPAAASASLPAAPPPVAGMPPLPPGGRIAVAPPPVPPSAAKTEDVPLAPPGSLVSLGKGESVGLAPPPVPKPSPPCPSCNAPWVAGNAVCPQCGYNSVTRTGGRFAQVAQKPREKLVWTYGSAHWDANDSFGILGIMVGGILCMVASLSGNSFSASAASICGFIGLGACVFGLAALAIRERFATGAVCTVVTLLVFRTAVNKTDRLRDYEVALEEEKRQKQRLAQLAEELKQRALNTGSVYVAQPVTPYVAPRQVNSDLDTFLKGPPTGVDELDWYRSHLHHGEVRIRLGAAQYLISDERPKDKFYLLARDFEERLKDEDAALRTLALRALARAPDARTVRLVLPLLADKDAEVRKLTFALLAQIKDPYAIPEIVARLGADSEYALAALAVFDEKNRDDLVAGFEQGLGNGDAAVRAACALELARRNGPRSAAALIVATTDGEPKVRSAAIAALGAFKDPKGFEAIAARLKDDKNAATLALERAGSPAEKALHAPLASEDREVRLAAVQVLRRIATKQSLQALIKAAADSDFEVAATAIETWAQIAPETMTPALTASIDLASADTRRWEPALKRLDGVKVDIEHKPVIGAALMKLVIGPDERLRKLSLPLLSTWAPDNGGTTLLTVIQETSDTQQRRYAMLAIGVLKDKRAPEAIAKHFETDRPEAADALIALGPIAEDAVVKLLYHDTPAVRVSACQVLGEIGSKYKAIPELQKLIQEDRANSGPEALKAIERIRNRPVKKSDTQPAK